MGIARRILAVAAIGLGTALGCHAAAAAESETPPHVRWSFAGPFGLYDEAQLQRGFKVYHDVCQNCHGINLLAFRNLADPGGPGFSVPQATAIAAQYQVTDGPNDQGDMFQRAGRLADYIPPPFPNEQAARAANGGAAPPDLSVMVKSRGNGLEYLWGMGGPDYVYGILNGFRDKAPEGFNLPQGKYYNVYFDGHAISMPPPLADNTVKFQDGTPGNLPQEAHDVVTFLTWAAEPYMEDRKQTGAKSILFLLVMTGVLYGAKRKVWKDLH
jgi:ubiquinol-cytochrome c reductase cytochrome b/c1 subunit